MVYRCTPRSLERRDAMHARILAAARKLFTSQGYEATTMQQVVHEAGTSIGNLYFYFPNKEALIVSLADEICSEVAQQVQAAKQAVPDGAGRLAVITYAGVRAMLERAELMKLLHRVPLQPVQCAERTCHRAGLLGFFENHPELAGGSPPELLAQALVGAIHDVVDPVVAGERPGDPDILGRWLARWSLQALGLPEATVADALAELEHYITQRIGKGVSVSG